MTSPVTASEADPCKLAIVTAVRDDLPAQGLPPSLLADLMDQIRCDSVVFAGLDSSRQCSWFSQDLPEDDGIPDDVAEAAIQGSGSTTGTARSATTRTGPVTCAAC